MKSFIAKIVIAGCLFFIIRTGWCASLVISDLKEFEKDGPHVALASKVECLRSIKLADLKNDDPSLEDVLNLLNTEIESHKGSFQIYVLLQNDRDRKFWESTKRLKLAKILKWQANHSKSPGEYLQNLDGFSLLMEITPWCGASHPSFFKAAIVIALSPVEPSKDAAAKQLSN